MTQNTNLNVSPYYDDFNENKNYSKVLFKPGYPVQARELTTLQSILQNQIERFGQYFFKEGSMVIPGGTFIDTSYFAVRIDPTFLNIPVKSYTKYLADNEIEIQGETSGVTATVVNRITDIESEDGFDTLYIKYKKSGGDGVTKTFADGENLITLGDIEYSNTRITANSLFARCVISDSTKTGSSASISEGVFFIRGYFVRVPSSTIILDQYTNTPSYRIGLSINEEIVSASSVNKDLYDNAKGYSNESAPGADRFKVSSTLVKKSLTDSDDLTFVELMRVDGGSRQEFVDKTDLNIFKDELARRTYDESGDYYTKPFKIELKETLNDRLGNRGLYFSNQTTKNGNTPLNEIYTIQVSPGKAYVRGNEIDKQVTTAIDVVKPRTTRSKENISLPIQIGNIAQVENAFGTPNVGFKGSYTVDLLDRRLAAKRVKHGSAVTIGQARVYDFNEKIVAGAATTQYDARLYDVQTFTNVTVGLAITAADSSYVKGKYSGSSGYLTSAVSNATILSLSGVRGEFQLNEPLEINGLDIGRNVTEIRDFDFTDVKSIQKTVGVSTFAADLVLDRSSAKFSERSNFTIQTNGNITSSSVADFRSLVNVGDVVRYTVPGDILPTFNRVGTVNKSNITVVAEVDVPDVCNGAITSSVLTTNDLDIIVPSLKQSSNPGYITKLPNEYVASINLLDSTCVVRKQISKNITATTFTFQLSDLGDNDLTFEPFTVDGYVLTWEDGIKEAINSTQVSFSANLKEVTIAGLSKVGNATLTFTAKRVKLLSKDKSIERCSNLIINRSKNVGSGVGSTTFSDGLTGPNQNSGVAFPYGTRVQDEEISLNVPDIHRVLGIFESGGTGDPVLPSFVALNQTATFSNNVVVGEQIIGSTSGAVARVVDIVSGTQLNFVYENQKVFEVNEPFVLQSSGIVGSIGSIIEGDADVSENYILDKGHRREFVDYGRIIRKSDAPEPTGKLRIIFDFYKTNESTGTVESINSYTGLDYEKEIPTVIDARASEFIDIRPRVENYLTTSVKSPFDFDSRTFASTSSETIISQKTIVLDYSYYLGRVDRLYLSKDGTFELKKGTPSESPKPPVENNEAMQVAVIAMDPYVFNATINSNLKVIPHRRYTMKDIGGLERRIKNLEEFTTLSLLETDTKNLSIKDPNTGLDKFKSGFFVDNFRSHKNHNLNGDSFFDIDRNTGECRPRTTERNVSLGFETTLSVSDPINADYAWVDDFSDANITRNGPGLTLKYDEVEFVDQPLATRVENLNPFHIVLYTGTVTVTPESDFWIEERILPTSQVANIDGGFDAIAAILGVDDRENGGMASSMFNTSEINWTGEETLISQVLTNETSVETDRWSTRSGRRTDTFRNRTITRDFDQTFEEQGLETIRGLELTSNQETQSLGNRLVSTETIFTVRSRNLELSASNLKPNTRYYVFVENVDMNAYAVPKRLPVTMTSGAFATGDIFETVTSRNARPNPFATSPQIIARVAAANHKIGPFNGPTETYSDLPGSYSNTSTIVNIDTADLALLTRPDRLGWLRAGQTISTRGGARQTAQATIDNIDLVSDETGSLIFSLHIPDPTDSSNPQFTTGANNIRITTSPTNERDLDPGESAVDVTFFSSGIQQNLEEQVLSIRQPQVQTQIITDNQPVTRINERTLEGQQEVITNELVGTRWSDPLAQSFLVPKENGVDGIFITSGEIFFKTKDPNVPITVQIRTMRDGSPSDTVIPFGETQIQPDEVNLSDDGSVATTFKFKTPVYLQGGYEYCFVLLANTAKYLTFITRMGEVDLLLNSVYNRQPYLGSLFKSQNSTTWDASQLEDLKFKLFKAKFPVNTPSTVIFYNNELPAGEIKKTNPVTAYSKRQFVSIAATTTQFEQGTTITQWNGASDETADIFATGGPVITNASSLSLTGAGIGLTDGTYTGIGFTSLTGYGSSVVATIAVASGVVNSITVTDGGSGYAVGDLLLSNNIGATGSGVRATVGIVTMTNLLVLDNVQNNFGLGIGMTQTDGGGTSINVTAPTSIYSDPIRDGYTLEVDHRNHGMHSSSNVVKIENFNGDVEPSPLTAKINDDSTTITVTSGSNFANFEGSPVGAANTGYVKIDKEIISYNTINGNEITIANRAVDASLRSDHEVSASAAKYEFNGISLLKINREHNFDNREKTFNNYYIRLEDTSRSFAKTKVGGGAKVRASQNIPFEYINPQVNTITPSGTSVTARIKTTSGTSLSGNETSFQDKGYESVALNKFNIMDDPRIVASKTNEYNLLNNQKSFALELTLSTLNENVSPIIDLDTTNIILTSNLVNEKVDDYLTDRRSRLSGFDPNSGIYETQRIGLEFPANSILVQFDGHRDAEADIRVFYKLFRNGTSDADQVYIPFNSDGSPDKTVNPNSAYNGFSEYKFTANSTPQFNSFMIKVVMTSTNQAKPPRIKNFRSIALRSFENE